ncbi:hypothetical protein [Pseudomonas sp. nanlin1]|uniref:hypothetical protein n=1 Tax=Pseudomonas sp. nanlin1 TaxID=3040605 RepID=UPI00388E3C6D
MADTRSFINQRTQTFETLKESLELPKHTQAKFVALNPHLSGGVVLAGDLVIVGDASTASSTAEEAMLMAKAAEVRTALLVNGQGGDDFFLENFELIKQMLAYTSIGIGAASDGWSRHLDAIKRTLLSIETLHREHMGSGTLAQREAFYAKRAALFSTLEKQLDSFAALGSGLRDKSSIKRLLGLSTKSYLHRGDIAGYADKVSGVAKASQLIKRGTYIGTALEVGSKGLAIRNACTSGREEQCRKAKYVEGSALVGSVSGAALAGHIGGGMAMAACVALGFSSMGTVTLVCAVAGGAGAGWGGGELGGVGGEILGEILYGKMTNE